MIPVKDAQGSQDRDRLNPYHAELRAPISRLASGSDPGSGGDPRRSPRHLVRPRCADVLRPNLGMYSAQLRAQPIQYGVEVTCANTTQALPPGDSP